MGLSGFERALLGDQRPAPIHPLSHGPARVVGDSDNKVLELGIEHPNTPEPVAEMMRQYHSDGK